MDVDKTQIALIVQEMGYIKGDLKDIKAKLEILMENYVQREELEARFSRLQSEVDKRFEGAHVRIDSKLDAKDFGPYQSVLQKILWLIISAVMVALLAIIGLKL